MNLLESGNKLAVPSNFDHLEPQINIRETPLAISCSKNHDKSTRHVVINFDIDQKIISDSYNS